MKSVGKILVIVERRYIYMEVPCNYFCICFEIFCPHTELQTVLLSWKQKTEHILLYCEEMSYFNCFLLYSNFCLVVHIFVDIVSMLTYRKSCRCLLYCDNIISVTDENAIFLFPCNSFFTLQTQSPPGTATNPPNVLEIHEHVTFKTQIQLTSGKNTCCQTSLVPMNMDGPKRKRM